METTLEVKQAGARADASPGERVERWLPRVAVGLLLGHAVLAWLGRSAGVATGQDDAWYYLLSRELLQLSYRDSFLVGAPPHGLYPPGYPLLLALWSPFGGFHFEWLVLLNILLSSAALALAYDATRRVLGGDVAILTLAVLAVNPFMLERAGVLMAEPAYLFFTMLALWQLARNPAGPAWGVIAAAVAAAMIRTIGVSLLLALAVHWLLEHRWRDVAVLVVVSMATLGAWLGWITMVPDKAVGKSYVADLGAGLARPDRSILEALLQRYTWNILYYSGRTFPWLMRTPTLAGTGLDNIAILGFHALTIGAGGMLVFRAWRSAALYVLVTCAVLAGWIWRVDRFLVPLLPLLVAALLAGVGWWVARWRPSWARPAMYAVAIVLIATASVDAGSNVVRRIQCGGNRMGSWPPAACLSERAGHFFEALTYVNERLPEGTAVYVSKFAPFHLYTGRLAAPVSALSSRPPEERLEYLRSIGVEYVLLTRNHVTDVRSILPLVEGDCEELEFEAAFGPETMLFRVRDGATGGNACEAVAQFRRLVDQG